MSGTHAVSELGQQGAYRAEFLVTGYGHGVVHQCSDDCCYHLKRLSAELQLAAYRYQIVPAVDCLYERETTVTQDAPSNTTLFQEALKRSPQCTRSGRC